MFDTTLGYYFGRIMTPRMHRWFSQLTNWIFAAVWIRSEQRHKWMWVDKRRYYSGELQSI